MRTSPADCSTGLVVFQRLTLASRVRPRAAPTEEAAEVAAASGTSSLPEPWCRPGTPPAAEAAEEVAAAAEAAAAEAVVAEAAEAEVGVAAAEAEAAAHRSRAR
jgi:hypothetical protein